MCSKKVFNDNTGTKESQAMKSLHESNIIVTASSNHTYHSEK